MGRFSTGSGWIRAADGEWIARAGATSRDLMPGNPRIQGCHARALVPSALACVAASSSGPEKAS
jgi:hypothetical protein